MKSAFYQRNPHSRPILFNLCIIESKKLCHKDTVHAPNISPIAIDPMPILHDIQSNEIDDNNPDIHSQYHKKIVRALVFYCFRYLLKSPNRYKSKKRNPQSIHNTLYRHDRVFHDGKKKSFKGVHEENFLVKEMIIVRVFTVLLHDR